MVRWVICTASRYVERIPAAQTHLHSNLAGPPDGKLINQRARSLNPWELMTIERLSGGAPFERTIPTRKRYYVAGRLTKSAISATDSSVGAKAVGRRAYDAMSALGK